MKLYLDVCCLERPFDDQTQDRIRLESEAIITIMSYVEMGAWQLIGSAAIEYEIDQNPDKGMAAQVRKTMVLFSSKVHIDDHTISRAEDLTNLGFST
ncbi:MAG: hypothetical protein NTX50_25190 [Candidatus Sumerlaeota bacterium]|nr:hypothetical protein [Candidatus Sumerlaeota bacterium]